MTKPAAQFDIDTTDFETRRDALEHWQWINEKLAEMQRKENFDTIYFERLGRKVKKLLEEATPVACLAFSFLRPRNTVFVTCLTGSQPYDAVLDIIDFSGATKSIKVEVTTIEDNNSMMRRQALSRTGHWSSGPMTKVGRKVTCTVEMENVEERHEKLVNLALSRAEDKLRKKPAYGRETAVLVYVDSYQPLPIRVRAELIGRTHELLQTSPDIYGVYYCHGHELVVDGVRPGRTNY